jgi:hypothetical protein
VEASRHLERLTPHDWQLLTQAAGEERVAVARSDPERLDELLAAPDLYGHLFGAEPEAALVRASPFLVFDVLLLRVARELEGTSFVSERVGGQRLPVFDVRGPADFIEARQRRLFLVDLLASYTRAASGSIWFRTGRRWRRRRYSDLDPMHLAGLAEVVAEVQRPAVHRRLGDLCLFLAGVFPDYVAAHPLEPRQLARIARLLGRGQAEPPAPSELVLAGGSGLWELEWVGRRAYRLAATAGGVVGDGLEEVASRFGQARRLLDMVARRHLFAARSSWFGRPGPDGE